MKTTHKTDTIRFSVKGQVVIPRWLRKEFEIEDGTRAYVYQDGDAIVLAVDVPSGPLLRADATVTFAALKPPLVLGDGPDRAGVSAIRPTARAITSQRWRSANRHTGP